MSAKTPAEAGNGEEETPPSANLEGPTKLYQQRLRFPKTMITCNNELEVYGYDCMYEERIHGGLYA